MTRTILIILGFFTFSFIKTATLDKQEAKKAFELINTIRRNPEHFYTAYRLNSKLAITRTSLKWNDTLARVAEAKALDMANRNYFSHVDPYGYGINHFIDKAGYTLNKIWLDKKANNYFESICYNAASGEDAVRIFLLDENTPSFGHRDHLLGIGDWNGSLKDIGIGFARTDAGTTYMSVVIAKHDW